MIKLVEAFISMIKKRFFLPVENDEFHVLIPIKFKDNIDGQIALSLTETFISLAPDFLKPVNYNKSGFYAIQKKRKYIVGMTCFVKAKGNMIIYNENENTVDDLTDSKYYIISVLNNLWFRKYNQETNSFISEDSDNHPPININDCIIYGRIWNSAIMGGSGPDQKQQKRSPYISKTKSSTAPQYNTSYCNY